MRRAQRFRAIALCAASALLLLCVATPACGETGPWQAVREGALEVRFAPEDERAGRAILRIASQRAPRVAAQVGLPALGPVSIVVAPTAEAFDALTRGGAPDWSVGCAFPERGVIVVRSPRTDLSPLRIEQVMEHELAHVAAGRALGGAWVPRWFDEGVATTIAGEWRLSESDRLADAARSGTLIPLERLEGSFPSDADEAALAYAQSFRAVELLLSRSGDASLAGIIATVRASENFDSALRLLSGADRSEFEDVFSAALRRRFRGAFSVLRSGSLFAGLALLVVAGALLKIWRGRRRVREWEQEDEQGRPVRRRTDSRWS